MSDLRKVSIVIPCYKQAEYLAEAIESALNQTVPAEIIVVNDGSTDNTSDIARNYPVKLIEQENKGLPSARNAGIKASSGDYIICLDSDDTLDQYYVEKSINALGKNTGIVRTGLRHFGDCDTELTPSPYDNLEGFKVNNQAYGSAMFPKIVWESVGGYDESMTDGYEDWDFWLRIVEKGYGIETIYEPLLNYRKHGRSMVDESREKHERLKKYVLRNYS